MKNTDHVVMRENEFVCLHCGRRYAPNLPAPVDVFVAMTKAFVKDHANCKPQAVEPLMKRFEPGGPL